MRLRSLIAGETTSKFQPCFSITYKCSLSVSHSEVSERDTGTPRGVRKMPAQGRIAIASCAVASRPCPSGLCPLGTPTLAAVRLGGWGLRSLRSLRSQPQSQRLGSLHRRQGAESSPLRGCGPHQPLDPCSVPSGGRVKARAATPKGHGLDADGTTNAQARGQVEQSEAARPPAPLPRGERGVWGSAPRCWQRPKGGAGRSP